MMWVNLIDWLFQKFLQVSGVKLCVLQYGGNSLFLASSKGHLNVMRYLIEICGVDVNAKSMVSEFD
jgi:hypothetical protein